MRVLLNIAQPPAEGDPLARATAAVAAGADGVGFADSPRLFADPLLEADRTLARTDAHLAGPCVLGLGLHHPAVAAQGISTLARHHPGRVFAVVGRGESSVRNEGLPVPSLARYEQALQALRERVTDAGIDATVLGAASGPRTLAVTAAHLPGVLIDAGTDPGVIAKALTTARASTPDVRCWLFLRVVVTASAAEQAAAAEPVLGSCAARLAAAPDWYDVVDSDRPGIAALAAAHDYRRHGTAHARAGTSADPAVDALVRDRFMLTGDPADIARRLRPIAALGLEGVVLAGAVAGLSARLTDTLLAVRSGLTSPPTRSA